MNTIEVYDREVVLGLDIGGTNTRLMLTDHTGKEIARRVLPTHPGNYDLALSQIAAVALALVAGHRLVAVGVGVAGVVENGVLTGSGNLPGWNGRDIAADIRQALDVPVVVLNDAQAAAMGEYTALGRPLIYVIWGTGVGAALVLNSDGRLVVLATEFGHAVIDKGSKLRCGCGGLGHIEALVSGGNIPKRRFGLRRGRKAEHLTDRQWRKVLRDMSVGLRSISTSAPGLPIVLGGGVASKQAGRLPELQSMVDRLQSSNPVPTLRSAALGEDGGLIGAAFAARQLAG